jgi:HemY protein
VKVVLLVLVAVLALGGLVGALVVRDPGYVLVTYGDLAVETSLWFALLALLVVYLAVRILLRLVLGIGRGSSLLRRWRRERRDRAAREQTMRGLKSLAEARWAEARKRLEGAAPHAEAPLINFLYAAAAAHHLGDGAGRDELFSAARAAGDDTELAVALVHAELLHGDRQWHACLAALSGAGRQAPSNARVLRLKADCFRGLGDWQALIELLPDLEKQRALPEQDLAAARREAWLQRLAETRTDPLSLWEAVPKDLRREPALVMAAARSLVAVGRGADAEPLLRQALEHEWSAEVLDLYGTLARSAPDAWLKKHPNDPHLLLALGRIGLANERWAQAREYLEASLKLRADPAVQGELGRLCLALGESERGGELAVQALRELPPLPLPSRGA